MTGFAAAGFDVRLERFFFFCVPVPTKQRLRITRIAKIGFWKRRNQPTIGVDSFSTPSKITLLLDAIKL
jgi:hypothetical protein